MQQVLIVEASHNQQETGSRYIASLVEEKLRQHHPDARYLHRDLAAAPLPALEATALQAFFTPPEAQSAAQQAAVQLSNQLSNELLASDVLVLSMPMWNFSIPSSIKNWIDHVVRSGITFNYTQDGLQGHAGKTRAIVVVSSGAVFSDGPMHDWDYLTPYLRHILHFIGIEDIQLVRVEGTIHAAQDAVFNAKLAVHGLAL